MSRYSAKRYYHTFAVTGKGKYKYVNYCSACGKKFTQLRGHGTNHGSKNLPIKCQKCRDKRIIVNPRRELKADTEFSFNRKCDECGGPDTETFRVNGEIRNYCKKCRESNDAELYHCD